MKNAMPATVLFAVLGLGLVLVYHLVLLVIAVGNAEPLLPLPLIFAYFALSVLLLVGLCRKSRLVWRIVLIVTALIGTMEVFTVVASLFLALREPTVSFWDGLECFFAATLMYVIFYLLCRPASRIFFLGEETVSWSSES